MRPPRLIHLPLSTLLLSLALMFVAGFFVTVWGFFFWLRSQPLP